MDLRGKMTKNISKKKLIISIILSIIVIATVTSVCVVTYGAWSETPEAQQDFELRVDKENPSLKYQIFVPLDENDNKLPGSYNIQDKNYTLDNPSDSSKAVSLALVGFYGGIAYGDLIIPEEHSYKINSQSITLPITRVLVDSEYATQYGFMNNKMIKTIVFPENIVYIAEGAFLGMTDLEDITFTGVGEIIIEDYAFAQCPKLGQGFDRRTLAESCHEDLIFTKG